jgi:hypothetical protein
MKALTDGLFVSLQNEQTDNEREYVQHTTDTQPYCHFEIRFFTSRFSPIRRSVLIVDNPNTCKKSTQGYVATNMRRQASVRYNIRHRENNKCQVTSHQHADATDDGENARDYRPG